MPRDTVTCPPVTGRGVAENTAERRDVKLVAERRQRVTLVQQLCERAVAHPQLGHCSSAQQRIYAPCRTTEAAQIGA